MAKQLAAALALLSGAAAAAAGRKPHLIYVIGDDVGWYKMVRCSRLRLSRSGSELAAAQGWHNPDARTPNLDGLVKEGVELDRFYTFKYCSPTRSSFLSGRLPIHNTQINIGGGVHFVQMEGAVDSGGKPLEFFSGVDYRMNILPKKLKAGGYESYAIGKWHGGDASVHLTPKARGFDHHFGFLSGGQDHNTQEEGCAATKNGAYIPGAIESCVDLWRDNGPAYGENGTYSAFLYTHEALRNIASHNVNTPMFMYLAYQNMHCPLQVPTSYEIPSIENEHLRLEDAMAHALDEGIGNVTSLLKSRGMWDDTILFFSVRPSSPASPPAALSPPLMRKPFAAGGQRRACARPSWRLPGAVQLQ